MLPDGRDNGVMWETESGELRVESEGRIVVKKPRFFFSGDH